MQIFAVIARHHSLFKKNLLGADKTVWTIEDISCEVQKVRGPQSARGAVDES